jgi:hypothetical protein
MVTEAGTPAVCGLVIVTNANPAGADASTVIGGLVVDVIEVFVRSDAVTVWLPTVFKVTVNWRKPFVSTPDVGDAVYEPLAVTRTLSALGTGFQ